MSTELGCYPKQSRSGRSALARSPFPRHHARHVESIEIGPEGPALPSPPPAP